MRFPPYVPVSLKDAYTTRKRVIARLLVTTLALAGAGWLGIALLSGSSSSILLPVRDELVPPAEMAWAGSGLDGQAIVELGDTSIKINIEAYNKKREREIAEDSGKLLSLAMELKTEVNSESGSKLSPDAVRKVKEIEKLAHRVKQTMTINMVGPS